MSSTRLRKAVKYPADDSNEDDLPHVLDEEGLCKPVRYACKQAKMPVEQEKFIAKMRQDNEIRDQQFLVCPVTNTWHIYLITVCDREYFLHFP